MHNLPSLSDLRLLCIVIRRGSLAAAASELGASPSLVSKRIAVLEGVLGTRLLHRTTRRIAATDEGEAVRRWAQRILARVRTWTDLEPTLIGRVEELIDFVTTD